MLKNIFPSEIYYPSLPCQFIPAFLKTITNIVLILNSLSSIKMPLDVTESQLQDSRVTILSTRGSKNKSHDKRKPNFYKEKQHSLHGYHFSFESKQEEHAGLGEKNVILSRRWGHEFWHIYPRSLPCIRITRRLIDATNAQDKQLPDCAVRARFTSAVAKKVVSEVPGNHARVPRSARFS